MTSEQFYSNDRYDPIRQELARLVWTVRLRDMDRFMNVYRSLREHKAKATIDWAQRVGAEETLAMLQAVISQERWADGMAVEPHRNGFLSFALEKVANSDGDFVASE